MQWVKGTNHDKLPPVQKDSWEVVDGRNVATTELFRHFPDLMDAFTAHALLLMGRHYRPCYAERGNWQTFAERLGPKTSPLDEEHCGYSTNPRYSAILIELVKEFDLDDPKVLDALAAGKNPYPPVAQTSQTKGVSK